MTARNHFESLSTERFPSAVYAETVLAVNFEDAKKYFFSALLDIHYAHTLMLERTGIIEASDAAAIVRALDAVDRGRVHASTYTGEFEDLFFFVEGVLTSALGPDVAGKMHTARSRNDIDLTLYRMEVRRELLALASEALEAARALLDLAEANIDTIIPAYTHTQPAQPTTLAHYLLAAIECLERDFSRLSAAFATVNRNPLGACAITTTGFPIDRNLTAELLGFEGLQVNSYGAIAAIDYLTESTAALAVCMINLGKLVQDLLLWCTREYGFLRLGDAYVQCSSIMPQKRNPVALEHTRILASKAMGQAQAILTCAHNTPFGDIVDSEDDLQPLVFTMFTDAHRALRLFAAAMAGAQFDTARLRAAAAAGFLTVTELADTLTRREGLSFRAAHGLVSATVKALGTADSPQQIVDELQRQAQSTLARPLRIAREELLQALDPEHFVRIRKVEGGPAPEVVTAEIARRRAAQAEMRRWIDAKRSLLDEYPRRIRRAAERVLTGSPARSASR